MRYWKPKKIAGNPKLVMVISSYLNSERRRWDTLSCLLYGLRAQSYQNWEAHVVHDGKMEHREELIAQSIWRDNRIKFIETPKRAGNFGHPHRREYALRSDGQYIAFANDDNYYMPTYFEWSLAELSTFKADFAYCDMIHSHKMWAPFPTRPKYKYLDIGGFVVSRGLLEKTPWTDFSFSGDGTLINNLARNAKKVVKVPATLFVHN